MISANAIHKWPVIRSYGSQTFRQVVLDTPLAALYWRVAPALHRYRRHQSPAYVDPPIDPFERLLVDPSRITRFTGREFPVWDERWLDFGVALDGDWDKRERPPIDSSYRGPDPSLYLAESFTETPLHEALEAHFVDGVPWEELAFVERVKRRAEKSDEPVWHQCSSVPEIRQHCRDLDQLYRSIREQGCLSMREINARENRRLTFREVMENEILVDVARDGEMLFVTGRHRLSMARILGLERIPVAIVTRHAQWVDRHAQSGNTDLPRDETPSEPERSLGEPLDVS